MSADNVSTRVEPSSAEEGRYRIYARLEIAAILESLQKSGSLVTAYFGGAKDFFLTSVVAVLEPEDKVVLDCGADEATNQRALRATNISFTAAHQRIKIQFTADSLRLVRYDGRESFCMKVPSSLVRLQRREFFRIDAPFAQPLKCTIPGSSTPDRKPLEMSILDISCGGVAMADIEGTDVFQTGVVLHGCRIDLPDVGSVTTDLLVKNSFDVTLKNGAKNKRFGFEFANIPERSRTLIQRYINKVERERRNKLAGTQ